MEQIWEVAKVILLGLVGIYVVGLILMAVRYILLGIAWAIFWLLDRQRLRAERDAKLILKAENGTLRDLVFKVGAGDEACARSAAIAGLQFLSQDLRPELTHEQREVSVGKAADQITAAFVFAREKAVADVCRAKCLYRNN